MNSGSEGTNLGTEGQKTELADLIFVSINTNIIIKCLEFQTLKINDMNTEQKIKLNMQLTVRNCVTLNEAVAKTIPKFMENYSILQSTTNEIQETR